MDPPGFDNPHDGLVDATGAARILGVKVATLYSYASRGRVRAFPSGRHREKRYLRADLERLRHRADARLGHEAVAAGALRWGEPVLSSALTEIRPDGPCYRGHRVVDLARTAPGSRRWQSCCGREGCPTHPGDWPRPRVVPACPRARPGQPDRRAPRPSSPRCASPGAAVPGASRRRGSWCGRWWAWWPRRPDPRPADVLAAPDVAAGRAAGAPGAAAREAAHHADARALRRPRAQRLLLRRAGGRLDRSRPRGLRPRRPGDLQRAAARGGEPAGPGAGGRGGSPRACPLHPARPGAAGRGAARVRPPALPRGRSAGRAPPVARLPAAPALASALHPARAGVRGGAAGARPSHRGRGSPRRRPRVAASALVRSGAVLHRAQRRVDRPRRRAAELGRAAPSAGPLRRPSRAREPGDRVRRRHVHPRGKDALHHRREPRHRAGHRAARRARRGQRRHRRQDHRAAPQAARARSTPRPRRSRRRAASALPCVVDIRYEDQVAGRGGEDGGDVRRHRHPGEQRQRHPPLGHASRRR